MVQDNQIIPDELVDGIKKRATEIIETLGQEHHMIAFIITPTHTIITGLSCIPKNIFKQVFCALLQRLNAVAYIIVGETWQAEISKNSPLFDLISSGKMCVTDLPLDDRVERLVINCVLNGKPSYRWAANISTNRDGERRICEWKKINAEMHGRMIIERW